MLYGQINPLFLTNSVVKYYFTTEFFHLVNVDVTLYKSICYLIFRDVLNID